MGGEPFCPGGPLIIHGSGFGDTQGRGFVAIGVPFTDSEGNALTQAYAAPVMSWSAGAIYAELLLPDGAEPGAYTVTIHRANGLSASGELTVGACPFCTASARKAPIWMVTRCGVGPCGTTSATSLPWNIGRAKAAAPVASLMAITSVMSARSIRAASVGTKSRA